MNCKNCKARCYWAGQDVAEPDHGNCFVGYVPKTNADRVRHMTDEELADWRSDGQCPPTRYYGDYDCISHSSCEDCWLDWLKQEVDNG